MDTPLRLVLIEDHSALRQMLLRLLKGAGHQVRGYACVEDFDDDPGIEPVDVFILDVNLPGEDGLSLCARLRASSPRIGLIVLSGLVEPEQMGKGYRSGADLYLPKPFHADTLLPALQSLAHRVCTHPIDNTASVVLDERLSQLHGPDTQVRLNPIECRLLIAFARAPQQQLASWQLAEVLGMDEAQEHKSVVESRMSRLRKKLLSAGYPAQTLSAEYGLGYRLTLPVKLI